MEILPLPAGKHDASLSNKGIVPIRQGFNVLIDTGQFGSLPEFLLGGGEVPVGNIILNGAGKQKVSCCTTPI